MKSSRLRLRTIGVLRWSGITVTRRGIQFHNPFQLLEIDALRDDDLGKVQDVVKDGQQVVCRLVNLAELFDLTGVAGLVAGGEGAPVEGGCR